MPRGARPSGGHLPGPVPMRARGTWSCWLEKGGMRPIRRSTGVQYHLDEREVVAGYFRGQRKAREKSRDRGQKTVEKSLRIWW